MMRNDRGRRGIQDNSQFDPFTAERINFWDLVYPSEKIQEAPDLIHNILPKAFDSMENTRLIDGLGMFI